MDRPLQVDLHSYPEALSRPVRPDLHYAVHVGIVLQGRFRLNYSGQDFEAHPGHVWFTSCWEPHAGEPLERTEIILCTLLLDALGSAAPFSGVSWTLPFLSPAHLRPREIPSLPAEEVRVMGEEFRIRADLGDPQSLAANWLLLHRLLLPFVSDCSQVDVPEVDALARVRPALDLLRKEDRDPVRIDEAAAACGLGRRRFCDLFSQAFGVSFGQFALRSRLAGAGEDVRRGTHSLRTVAHHWGFYDVSHLHRTFLRHYGCSPAEYRARRTART